MNLEALPAFFLFCVTSLLAILNPLTVAPIYLALTDGYTSEHRQSTLRRAITTGLIVLVVFSLLGGTIFQLFGITIHAFRIAGGFILFGIGADMLQAKQSRVRTTAEEEHEGTLKEDIGITPLGIPLIVGPGSITTVMVLTADAVSVAHAGAVLAAIVVVLGGTYIVLDQGERLVKALGQTGLNVMTRIMGLIVTVIAVQFVLDGVRPVLIEVLQGAGG